MSYGLLSIPFLVGTYKLSHIIYGIIWAIKAAHRHEAEVDSINILFLIILDQKITIIVGFLKLILIKRVLYGKWDVVLQTMNETWGNDP